MPDPIITLEDGTTVARANLDGNVTVVLDHPDAPADMRPTHAGRIIEGGYQPPILAAFGLRPATLRAIADLIEAMA